MDNDITKNGHQNSISMEDLIKKKALALGFSLCGINKAKHLIEDGQFVENWMEKGYNAGMSYFERNKDKRYNPSLLVDNTKSIITVLLSYYPETQLSQKDNYRISKYAYGQDYHYVIKDKLALLLEYLKTINPEIEGRAFVDSAPFLDRAWANKAGLGFIGKNTCLINKDAGSFFFIGQLLVNIELDEDKTETKAYCGTCTRCIDSCPTGALVAPHQLDSNKCISYLTIEHKGDLPQGMEKQFSNYIFGCDICQDVCPWNKFSIPTKVDDLKPSSLLAELKTKADWENMKPEQFGEIFRGTAVKRTKYKGLMRNINYIKKVKNKE
ncbi:MAG: tRNA epoxyqueuosine(34) reductase QueG [Hyphomicrobiales bacterium]